MIRVCWLLHPSASASCLIPLLLQAATSLCFGKTAHLQYFGSKLFASALPPSQGDRYYSAYSFYSAYSIYNHYNHYNHYPSYPFYRFFPCILAIPPFPAIGGLFRLTPFQFSLRQKPICFFRADAFSIIFEAEAYPFLSGWRNKKSRAKWFDSRLFFSGYAFPIMIEAEAYPFLSGYRLSDLFRLNACIKKLSF